VKVRPESFDEGKEMKGYNAMRIKREREVMAPISTRVIDVLVITVYRAAAESIRGSNDTWPSEERILPGESPKGRCSEVVDLIG